MELLGIVVSYGTLFCGLFLFSPNTTSWFRTICSVSIVMVNLAYLCYVAYQLRGVVAEARKMVVDRFRRTHLSSGTPDPRPTSDSISTAVEMTVLPAMHTNAMFEQAVHVSPAGWTTHISKDGKPYYHNDRTGVDSWTLPEVR